MENIINDVIISAQLAAALEVSASPKPGNVHRTADYAQTRFEHFLAGSIALGPAVREAALQGIRAVSNEIKYNEIGVGRCLKMAILNIKSWHSGGNTHLGSIMLFIPLAAAASAIKTRDGKITVDTLRKEVIKVIESTTYEDALNFIQIVSSLNLGWLGKTTSNDFPDISSKNALIKIKQDKTTFYNLMEYSSKWDGIACELTSGLKNTFTIGYPEFIKTFNETKDINISTVNTFLKILSEVPDTFIARKIGSGITNDAFEAIKIGLPISLNISEKAKQILEQNQGMITSEGRLQIENFDRELRRSNGTLNPGTTADLTAASLMISLLLGFRL